jgi:hypothetical protein
MNDGIKSINHQLDCCRRRGALRTRVVDARRQARQGCDPLPRQSMDAPSPRWIMDDLQEQAHCVDFFVIASVA